ncbi:MAG: right-handed parallel beta-helix repeat-containing protein [Candidatus ainarchaeum sp.]|nr:right-handed parallel beta-helix repeat-containing protein [Candidatus ainarchaeum sp.]
MGARTVLAAILFFSCLAAAATIGSCQNLTARGETYALSGEIFWNGAYGGCLNISADGITLDCQGHWINGTDETYTYGVYNGGFDGVTVRNCKIARFDHSIYWYMGADNGVIEENTLTMNDNGGIVLEFNCTNNTVSGNTLSDNGVGISLLHNCKGNVIAGNTARDIGDSCVYVGSFSSNNLITGQQCTNAYFGVYLDGQSDNNTVLGNSIEGGQSGIMLHSASSNNEVRDNTVSGAERGIYLLYEADNNQISNNVVAQSSWFDVSLDSSTAGNTGANTCQTLEDEGSNAVTCAGAAVPAITPTPTGGMPEGAQTTQTGTATCCVPGFILFLLSLAAFSNSGHSAI